MCNFAADKTLLGKRIENMEVTKMALLKETPLIQVVDEPVLPLEREKFGKVKEMVLGGLLFGFLIVIYLSISIFFKNIIRE